MLQQTQVARVLDRYPEFLERFPTATACADGTAAEVIELWVGLGYNRRALNLWRAASEVAREHDGVIPNDLATLLALPGVGPYTARAIMVFAFEEDIGVVDTNVGRLLARWTGQKLSPKDAQRLADEMVPTGDGWRWNQSLFDFAVAQCTKRKPACSTCLLESACVWRGEGDDPAVSSAGVSGRQSRFEGSSRQVRGRIIDALRRGPIAEERLVEFGRPTDVASDVERIADSLVADGLAVRSKGEYRLPGS